MLTNIMIGLHTVIAIVLIGLILLQQGKGAEAGGGFGGGGASGTLFGSRGSANFLSRSTAVLAALFFGSNLILNPWLAQTYRADAGFPIPVATEAENKDNTPAADWKTPEAHAEAGSDVPQASPSGD